MSSSYSAKQEWPFDRVVQRVSHDSKIIFKGRYGANLEGRVRDISENGIYILSTDKFTVGTEILLYVPVEVRQDRPKMCIIPGKIVRLGSSKEEQGFAVRFTSDISLNTKAIHRL